MFFSVDAANLIPLPPYKIAPLDGLLIRVTILDPKEGQKIDELVKNQPINGLYRVEVSGEVNLGFDYLSVSLGGKTIPEATKIIETHLRTALQADFNVLVALVESRALQQIRGEHLVRQDGQVTLGIYGSVAVSGLTIKEAKLAIEKHLTEFLFEPAVSVDVIGYNSKVYYVIVDLGDAGKQVTRWPITGSETVLDALGQIKGLPAGTSSKRIWVRAAGRRSQPIRPRSCRSIGTLSSAGNRRPPITSSCPETASSSASIPWSASTRSSPRSLHQSSASSALLCWAARRYKPSQSHWGNLGREVVSGNKADVAWQCL